MITIFFRTVLIYLMLMLAMRLMGKRQIGELEVSELIITLLLSDIATLPIENQEIPVMYAVIPTVTLMTMEIATSQILAHCPRLKAKLSQMPSMLICQGEIDQKELCRNRLSVDELLAALRQQGVVDPKEVEYAFLEKNGNLSVVLWEAYRPATAADVKAVTKEEGAMHLIVSNGLINRHGLALVKKSEVWLTDILREHHMTLDQVLYLVCNDGGRVEIVQKEEY